MADVNSNINININTAAALAQLRSLQAGLSRFHQSLAEGNLAAANAQKGLNAQLLQSIGAIGKFSASQVKVAGSTLAFTSALEKNKLSLREYYRYTMAAATANTRVMGKAFAQEREIINRARRDRVKALQAQYIQMNKSNAGFMDAIRVMPKSLAMANGKFTELGTRIQYAAQRQQFLNQLLKQGSTQLLNFGKNTQWAGRQLMVGLTMPLALFGSAAAKTFKELEAEIVKFRRVYGDAFTNDAETDAAVENIKRLATEYTKYGVSVTKTVEMAATAAAAGFSGTALNAQVETATKLAVLGQIEQQQALETTISLQSAFGISSEELAKKIDFLNAVENQTLLSIEDLTIAIPKAAPVVKQLGGSVEDLAFFLTAMKEGGINASEGANALKSGLASLINPSDKAAKFLANLGINIKGIVEGNSGDIKATVVGFAQALDTLDPLSRARAIEQMFGKFQFSRLSTLFQNVTKDGTQASRALSLAGKSVEELAILSEREMKKIEDSVGVKFQAAVEQFKQDIMPLGKIFLEALTPVVKFFGNLFEKFNGLSDQTKKIIAVIVGVVAGLGPVVLMTFGLLMNAIANGVKLFALLRGGIAKLNGQTSVMGSGFNYMTQEQIENAASSQQLHQTHTRLIEVFNVEANSVNALASSYNSLSTQMRSMASQNPALFAGGMPGAKASVSKLPPVRKYKDGILTVPGPKGAGDIQPAMLAPGEAVIPAKTTEKYKGLISAIFNDKVPGFMAGRIPAGRALNSTNDLIMQRIQSSSNKSQQAYPGTHPERQSGSTFIGMPSSFAEASQSRQILDKISNSVKFGKFGSIPPTNFGTLLQPFSGRSFPARGVGGVYRKPNGELVVVKPTIDDKTALAEVRATEIAREVHGLVSPKQSIKTMIDPTDPTKQRKFIVIESPYDPKIAAMDGKFSKSDMVKQLVASTLRGDKDLQKANLSGNVLSDVGTAGVFDRASGFRDFAKAMPSMEQQAVVNLLGVKGGAKKFFAQETSGIAAGMSPAQYDAAIKAEINRSIPRLEKVLKSFNLNPEEKVVYDNMLKRLKNGAKTDWSKLQPIHARAGEGIAKAIDGIDPDASKSIIEKQLTKYSLPQGTQADSLVDDLKRNAQSEFVKGLEKLDPQRRAVIEAAWRGGKVSVPPSGKEQAFNSPRQTAFLNEISKMVPVRIGNEIKYVHKDDYDLFKADPDGRAKYARSSQQIIDNMLYRMGVTKRGDSFVASGKFTGRFAGVDHFKTDLKSTGKTAGGGSGTLSSVVRRIADAQKAEFNARVGDPLKTKTGKAMLAAGFTPDKVRYFLRPELSHIVPTESLGIGGRQGDLKMKTGEAQFDTRLVNTFMATKRRSSNILEWNKKDNPLKLTPREIEQYRKAADFMSRGLHPATAEERALVAKAAELDQRVFGFNKRGGNAPAKLLPKDIRLSQALSTVLSDKAFKPSQIMNLAATDPSQVLVKPGEYRLDKNKGTLTKLTTANTGPKPAGSVSSTGKASDRRLSFEGPGQTTVTKSQAMRIRGRDAGDPGATLTPYQRQELKKIEAKYPGMDENQLKKILKRKLKADEDILKAKEKEAAAARKAAKRAELLPKQEAALKAKADKIENERQSRLIQASKDQEKAIKMNAKIDKERTTMQKRMIRQERVGRVSGGASMALGTAGMGLMMAGQQTAGMAAMGASAVAGLAPMFAKMGPVGLTITALASLGSAVYLVSRSLEKAAKKQSEFANQTSATTDKMKRIGEITGNVGASEIMDKRRSSTTFDSFSRGYDRAGQQFGTNFMSSEVGKEISKGFGADLSIDRGTAVKKFALQISQYVSDGVINGVQAGDIARQLAVDFKDMSLYPSIVGQLTKLIGPDGSNLLKDPMKVRVLLSQEQTNVATVSSEGITTQGKGQSAAALLGLGAGNNVAGDAASAALSASLYVRALETNKANIDATNVQYEKEKEVLNQKLLIAKTDEERSKIQTKINNLTIKNERDNKKLSAETTATLLAQQKAYDKTSRGAQGLLPGQINFTRNAFITANKEQVRTRFAGTALEKDVNPFLDKTASLKSTDLEIKINAIAGTGTSPIALANLIDMLGADEKQLERELDLGIKTRGVDKTVAMLQGLGVVEDNNIRKELFIKINAITNEKEFADVGSTLTKISEMEGKDFDINTYLKGNAFAKLKELSELLRKVQNLPDPIEKTAIASVIEKSTNPDEKAALSAVIANWEWLLTLPKDIRKTATTTLITAFDMVGQDQIDAEIAKRVAAAGSGASYAAQYYSTPAGQDLVQSYLAGEAAKPQYTPEELEKAKKKVINDQDSIGKGNPLAFLDPLAMALKQVRDNSFNALKPVESLLAAFTNKKTQQDAFSLFDGIQNRLATLGAGKDLRDAIGSMSAEDFAKVAALTGDKALFTFAKGKPKTKDSITGLTETGKAVNKAYNEKNLGEFRVANEETIQNIKDQSTAYKLLISSGLSASQALEVVSNQSQAAAIAAGDIKKGTKEWDNYIKKIKTASTNLERQAVLNSAIRANEEFKMYEKMPELVSQMKELGYSTDQIDAVLRDPDLAKFIVNDLKNGKGLSKDIADNLNSIEARKIIDIQVALNKGDLLGAAGPGLNIVDELFAAQEGLISNSAMAQDIILNDRKIRDIQETKIDPLTKDVEKLSAGVEVLSRELEMNPLFGDRAIQKIQDENSNLSNDLTLISKAAEQVNKRYDEQAEALSKVEQINENILDQQKKQIDLADAITSGDISAAASAIQEIRAANASRFASAQRDALEQARENALGSLTARPGGLTKEQIDEKQFENSQKIYKMETDPARVQILKDIQSKQDSIYNIEKGKIKPLQEQIDKLVDQNKEWQLILDKQTENVKVLGDTKLAWDKITASIVAYAAAKKASESSTELGGLLESRGQAETKTENTNKTLKEFSSGISKEIIDAQKTIKNEKPPVEEPSAEELRKIRDQWLKDLGFYSSGGIVPKYFANGGYSVGTDTVPAMLTPGEFVMSKYAVEKYGLENMKSINSGSAIGDSVYNYNLNVNVKSDANPDDIARAVMVQIKSVDAQRIRGARF